MKTFQWICKQMLLWEQSNQCIDKCHKSIVKKKFEMFVILSCQLLSKQNSNFHPSWRHLTIICGQPNLHYRNKEILQDRKKEGTRDAEKVEKQDDNTGKQISHIPTLIFLR